MNIDKLKLGIYDRRRKLTDQQKIEIYNKYHNEPGWSLNKLAAAYGVSKKTILLIVNKDSKAKNDQRIKEHWKDYKPSREIHKKAIQSLRYYKRELVIAGLIGGGENE